MNTEKIEFLTIAKFFIFPFIIFVLNYIIFFLGVYDAFPWIDIPMHFIGGLFVGYSYFLTLKYLQNKNYLRINSFTRIIFVITLVSLTAVLWEFYEFFLTSIFEIGLPLTLEDTLLDMFLGIFGGFFVSVFLELNIFKS